MRSKRRKKTIIKMRPISYLTRFLFELEEAESRKGLRRVTQPPTPNTPPKDAFQMQMELIRGESSIFDPSMLGGNLTLSELNEEIQIGQAEMALRREAFENLAQGRFEPVQLKAIFANITQERLQEEDEPPSPFLPRGKNNFCKFLKALGGSYLNQLHFWMMNKGVSIYGLSMKNYDKTKNRF